MKTDTLRRVLKLLQRLEEAKIAYSLRHSREDALLIAVNVPGQRWNIEFVDYGDEFQVEIERFVSNGHMDDEVALEELFMQFSGKESDLVARRPSARKGALAKKRQSVSP